MSTARLPTGSSLELTRSSGSFSSTSLSSTQRSVQHASPSLKPSSDKQQQQQEQKRTSKLSTPAMGGVSGDVGGLASSLRSAPNSAPNPAYQMVMLQPAFLQSLHSQAARAPHTFSLECGSAVTKPSSAALSVSASSRQFPAAPLHTSTLSSRQHKPRND